ncbi:hypothetical protein AXF42_Ash002987 [Apostasia shenzhenica]|uniref:Uncharacterized protein n=1 Tax=Apostasia shenzhenica TaxID=1088818 RepID=A0A2I0A7T5_9ASPA|nr:hypothetical protein AXF42_Ash002987 [Apostasia shenzhenica]
MHRSGSTTRASDEYYLSTAQAAVGRSVMDIDHLPTYDPQSDIAKKEAARLKFAESMVHLIPLVIIICGMVLWLFSNPEIELTSKDDSILARIKNMSIDGYSNWNGTSMTTIGMDDLDPIDGIGTDETGRGVKNDVQI